MRLTLQHGRRGCVIALTAILLAGPARSQVRAPVVEPAGPSVDSLVLTPALGVVGRTDTHAVTFVLTDTIPVTGGLRVTWSPEFNISAVSATYSDIPRPGVPGVSTQFQDGQSFWIYLDSTGTPAPPGTVLQLTLADAVNASGAGQYQAALEVFDGDGAALFGPTLSAPFNLSPDTAESIALLDPGRDSVQVGALKNYVVEVYDGALNRIDTATIDYQIDPSGLGVFAGSVLQTQSTGKGVVSAHYGPLSDTSDTLVILPGPLYLWTLTGVPPTTIAGSALATDSVVVTARDAFGNIATGHSGPLYFATGDTSAQLPATQSSPYLITPDDSGRVAFPASQFVWYRSGIDTLTVSGSSRSVSVPLSVMASTALDFSQLAAPDTVTAGVPFSVTAAGAVDSAGNPASGLITLFVSGADSSAPGGQLPNLPSLAAVNGGRQQPGDTLPVRLLSGVLAGCWIRHDKPVR